MEGQNLQHLKYGTANAESLTLSFWVKSNKTGTYILEFISDRFTEQISQSYTINHARHLGKENITFVWRYNRNIDNDNGTVYIAYWWFAGWK